MRVKISQGTVKKKRRIEKAIAEREGGLPCEFKLVVEKAGARSCSTCGARAATAKTIMLCQRTGRLPGINVGRGK